MEQANPTFTLDELGKLTELPRRTVRYYIQQGLIDKPTGVGRGAHYTSEHLDQLLEIRKWQHAGLSLDRIRELLSPTDGQLELPPPRPRQRGTIEVWSHVVIDEGIELTIDPKQAGLSPEAVRALVKGVVDVYDKLSKQEEKA